MGNVEQYTKKIRDAIYGNEVRGSIADAIDKMDEVVIKHDTDMSTAITNANTATTNAKSATTAANAATTAANEATTKANAAATACEGIVVQQNTMVDTVTGKSAVLSLEDGIICVREA